MTPAQNLLPRGRICLAVYRPNLELLDRQIESIQNQSLTNWRCSVVIDGPDSKVRAHLEEKLVTDERFEIIVNELNLGHYRNFEKLVSRVRSDETWFALADQDDFWLPEKLGLLVTTLCRSGATAVSGQAAVVAGDEVVSRTRRRSVSVLSQLVDNQVTGSLAVFHRSVVDVALPFPQPTSAAYHDHWIGLVARTLGEVRYIQDVVQDYIQHSQNVLGEETGLRLGARIKRLFVAERGSERGTSALATITWDRWGWRVTMAKALVERSQDTPADISFVANEHRSLMRLAYALSSCVLRRETPVLRTLALLIGAALSSCPRRKRATG